MDRLEQEYVGAAMKIFELQAEEEQLKTRLDKIPDELTKAQSALDSYESKMRARAFENLNTHGFEGIFE